MTTTDILKFRRYIHRFFELYGRHDLPWRQDYDPYRIMVSEIMLQQTQVDRVIPKFLAFLDRFPTVKDLAQAPVSDVIRQWQGLGYNRRGLNLQKAAQKIMTDFQGQVPAETEALLSLPGIGPYAAAAIQAFAFNLPSTVIETNIRTLFIFHFFPESYIVEDKELITLVTQTLDTQQPRIWYSALMDYGSYLKQILPNPGRKSKAYSKQGRLKGSNREVRGKILKALASQPSIKRQNLAQEINIAEDRIEPALQQLLQEGFVIYNADELKLP